MIPPCSSAATEYSYRSGSWARSIPRHSLPYVAHIYYQAQTVASIAVLRRSKQHDHIPAVTVGKLPGLMVNFDQDIKEKGRASGIVGRLTSYSWWGEGTDKALYCWRTLGPHNPNTEVLMQTEGRFLLAVWKKEKKLLSLHLFVFEHDCFADVWKWLTQILFRAWNKYLYHRGRVRGAVIPHPQIYFPTFCVCFTLWKNKQQ